MLRQPRRRKSTMRPLKGSRSQKLLSTCHRRGSTIVFTETACKRVKNYGCFRAYPTHDARLTKISTRRRCRGGQENGRWNVWQATKRNERDEKTERGRLADTFLRRRTDKYVLSRDKLTGGRSDVNTRCTWFFTGQMKFLRCLKGNKITLNR